MRKPEHKMLAMRSTPLEKVVGFAVSEQTYDRLTFMNQLIIDMRIEGFTFQDISAVLGMKVIDVKRSCLLIRKQLANSELLFHIEMKQHYREHNGRVLNEAELGDSFGRQNLLEGLRDDER